MPLPSDLPPKGNTDVGRSWKWGGSVNAGSITYSATPQKNRVPQKEPPADKSRYFRVWYEKPKDGNGKRNQGKRYGVNGKEYDLMQITECVHDLRRQSFAGEMLVKGASKEFDCAGYFTLLWWLGVSSPAPFPPRLFAPHLHLRTTIQKKKIEFRVCTY